MQPAIYDFFISYNSKDLKHAERIYERLTAAGFRVWFDKSRLKPGYNWRREIEEGRNSSRYVLPILTERWRYSEWCAFETYGIPSIVPLLCDGEFLTVAPQPLHGLQFVDIRSADDESWDRFIEQLREVLNRPVSLPATGLHLLPFSKGLDFIGREKTLLEMHDMLCPGVEWSEAKSAALTSVKVLALAGLGGVGKTTLARAFVELFALRFADVRWINAEADHIVGQMAKLAKDLGVANDKRAAARDKLLQVLCSPVPRLLVFDNVGDEASIKDWIPPVGGCHVLITTRFTAWSRRVEVIPVDVLEPESAHELLRSGAKLKDLEEHRPILDRIAQQLGNLPLALELAAKMIREMPFTPADWLRFYEESPQEILGHSVDGVTDYPQPVAKTWQMSVEQLDSSSKNLLKVLAFLAPDYVPVQLLDLLGNLEEGTANGWSGFALRKTLGQLKRYSLIKLEPERAAIHRLVQAVQRDQLSVQEQSKWAQVAMDAVSAAFLYTGHSLLAHNIDMMPHVLIVAKWAENIVIEETSLALFYNRAALFFKNKYEAGLAKAFRERAIELYERLDVETDENAAWFYYSLAIGHEQRDDFEQAEPLFRRALRIFSNVWSKDRAKSLILHHLGWACMKQGKHEEGKLYLEETIEIIKRGNESHS